MKSGPACRARNISVLKLKRLEQRAVTQAVERCEKLKVKAQTKIYAELEQRKNLNTFKNIIINIKKGAVKTVVEIIHEQDWHKELTPICFMCLSIPASRSFDIKYNMEINIIQDMIANN